MVCSSAFFAAGEEADHHDRWPRRTLKGLHQLGTSGHRNRSVQVDVRDALLVEHLADKGRHLRPLREDEYLVLFREAFIEDVSQLLQLRRGAS